MSITSKEEGEQVLESTLTVTSPFLDEIGSYRCTAENVVDTANSTAEVVIFCECILQGIVVNEKDHTFVTHTFHCSCSHFCVSNIFLVQYLPLYEKDLCTTNSLQ